MKWLIKNEEKALAEGWNIYCCIGSVDGEWQVQCNDDYGTLENDEEAWKIVANGTEEHHKKALEFILEHNPSEYYRILKTKEE